jgi:hypothetical protein
MPEYPWSPCEDYRLDLLGDAGVCAGSMIYTTKLWQAEVDIWSIRTRNPGGREASET